MLINQKDIAREVGVSQKTVSLYFKEASQVSEKTRKKIAAVVKRHNYFPNAAARSIRSNRFNRIACVVAQYGKQDSVMHPHLLAYINGASLELAKHGLSLVVEPVFIDLSGSKVDFPEFFSIRSADGIIGIAGSWIPPEVDRRVAGLELPTVWLNRDTDNAELNCLLFDEKTGALELARHFLEKGVRHIAFFGPDYRSDTVVHYSSRVRYETVRDEMMRHGGSCRAFFCGTGEPLDSKARELLMRLPELDGAICYNYTYRHTVFLEALNGRNDLASKRIGHFASSWEFHPRNYPFWDYVEMPEVEMGKHGAEFILKQLRGEEAGSLLKPLAGKLYKQS